MVCLYTKWTKTCGINQTDTVHAYIWSFCIWIQNHFLLMKCFTFPSKYHCSVSQDILQFYVTFHIFTCEPYQKYCKKYFNSLRKAKIQFATSSLSLHRTGVLIWRENSLEKKILLDLSCMLWGKRKGRWKRPFFFRI